MSIVTQVCGLLGCATPALSPFACPCCASARPSPGCVLCLACAISCPYTTLVRVGHHLHQQFGPCSQGASPGRQAA